LLERISSLLVHNTGDKIEEFQFNERKEEGSEEEDYQPDMRIVLGYLNQCESI